MNVCHLVADMYLNAETLKKAFRSLERQLFRSGNDAADIVGKTAVGVRDVGGTLKYDNLCAFIKSSDSGCGSGSSSHASDNNNFHFRFSPLSGIKCLK